MKNFLNNLAQRVIGGVWAIILVLAALSVIGIIDPGFVSDYYQSMKKVI